MMFNLPLQLIFMLKIQFQAPEVLFCLPGTNDLQDGDANEYFVYHLNYHTWTATSVCDNDLNRFHQPSLVICQNVSTCIDLMQNMPLSHRLSNTFLTVSVDLDSEATIESQLRLDDTLITFDPGSGTITEYYGIQGKNMKMTFGRWSTGRNNTGTFNLLNHAYIWERRSNLMGLPLRASVLNWDHISYEIPLSQQGQEEDSWGGYIVNAAKILSDKLNFTLSYTSPVDMEWGAKMDDEAISSNWTGMVGQLVNDEADMCLSGISLVLDRIEVMDFTLTLISALNTVSGLKPEKSIRGGYLAFLKVFDCSAWIGLVAMAVTVGTVTSVVLLDKHTKGCLGSFGAGVTKFGLACLQIGDSASGRLHAWRILQVTTALCGFLCFTAYTSDLTAILTVGQAGQLPKNFAEVISDHYKILVARGAWPAIKMENSSPGSDMKKAFDNHTTVFEYNGDLEAVFHIMTEDPKLLYYGDSLQFEGHSKFKIGRDFEEVRTSLLPIGLQKNSEFLRTFNYHLIKMRQTGLFSKLSRRWLNDDNPGDWSDRIYVDEASAMDYSNVLFPLLLLASGALIAMLLACIEKLEKIYTP